MRLLLTATSVALIALAGCKSIGPGTVARDRFQYGDAIGESWKRQTLLNIVKLRYLDPPIFVDVGQIVAGYTLEGTVAGGATLVSGGNNSLNFGATGKYTDRPTVTYTPLTGNKFIKSLMTPLTPESIFYLIQGGWPADNVLHTALASINGLKNQTTTVSGTSTADPDFTRVLTLLREIQISGAVAFRVQVDPAKQQTSFLTFRRENIRNETLDAIAELRRLLVLDPNAYEFKLVFGATATNDKEIAVVTRSIINLMQTMSGQIDVPAKDLAERRATLGWEQSPTTLRSIEIHSSKELPSAAFVAVNYRDHWFWIDDRDLKSKRVFSFMMLMFTLADPGEKEPLPMVTIPTS
jgi:hypothetical protein